MTQQAKRMFFQMRVTEDFLQALDDMRRWEPGIPMRTEMARRILQKAIDEWRREEMKRKAA